MPDVDEALRLLTDPERSEAALRELRTWFLREDLIGSDQERYNGYQFGFVEDDALAAWPVLLDLAERPSIHHRHSIVELLGEVAKAGPRVDEPDEDWSRTWAATVPRLLALLADADPELRTAAAIAVVSEPSGDLDGTVAAALRSRFDVEPDLSVRLNLVFAMGELVWPTELEDLRFQIPPSTGSAEPDPGVVSWLRRLVTDPDPRIGLAAVLTLHWLEPAAPIGDDMFQVVVNALREPDPGPWARVIDVHRPYRPGTGSQIRLNPGPVPLLVWVRRELRRNVEADHRLAAAFLGDVDPDRRQSATEIAAAVLCHRRSPTEQLLPMLADRLANASPRERRSIEAYTDAHVLAAIGEPAARYVDLLAALAADDTLLGPSPDQSPMVADIGVWALARLGDPACVPALRERLEGSRLGFSPAATPEQEPWTPQAFNPVVLPGYGLRLPGIGDVLSQVAQFAEQLTPAVLHRLRAYDSVMTYKEATYRRVLLGALESWGPAAAPALPYLLVDNQRPDLAVARVLGAIGVAAAPAAPLLYRWATTTPAEEVVDRMLIAQAYARVSGDPTIAVEAVADLFASHLGPYRPRSNLRGDLISACRIAAELGPHAAAHRDTLRTLLSDPGARSPVGQADRRPVRIEAAYAWWRVTGEPDEAIAFLTTALDSVQAACHLIDIDPTNAAAGQALRGFLADDRRHTRYADWRAFTDDEKARRKAIAALTRRHQSPAALLRHLGDQVLYRCEYRDDNAGLADPSRAYWRGEADPLGAAAVAAAADVLLQWNQQHRVESIADGWVSTHGLVFAARACAELGGLTIDSETRHGGHTEWFVRRHNPRRSPHGHDAVPALPVIQRVRAYLAAASEREYQEVSQALETYRGHPRQRTVVSYLLGTDPSAAAGKPLVPPP